jgi:outer membrane protein OmpA-like peptidoglycan-associated protein
MLIASGFVVSLGASIVAAAERPSETQILNALKPGAKTRGMTTAPAQPSAEDQRFIDSLRNIKTRSLSTGERQKAAAIVKDKPSIDLEIYFNYDSADITPKAVPDLMTLGRALTKPELRGGVFLISGYTDAKGGDEYNQHLSERRAEAVKRFLMQKFGLTSGSLVTAGYGKEQLKNTAEPFAAENRRVQIANMEAKQQAGK